MGSDSVPDSVERRVEDSIDGLGREMKVSALGDGEGIFEEIRAVEELRMVWRDTVVVSGPLPVRENVCRSHERGMREGMRGAPERERGHDEGRPSLPDVASYSPLSTLR